MRKTQQGAAIAVCTIGMLACLISAGVLLSELGKERAVRERLEQEAARLRQEIETLKKTTRYRGYIWNFDSDYGTVRVPTEPR